MDIHDLYDDVTTGGTGEYVLAYRGNEFVFDVTALKRTRKNDILAVLPDGLLGPTSIPDDVDPEEIGDMTDEELIEKIEASGGDVGELMSGQILDEEATEVVIDAMVDAYSHPKLSDTELENILTSTRFPDREFNQMLSTMIEVSSPDESIREFRGET